MKSKYPAQSKQTALAKAREEFGAFKKEQEQSAAIAAKKDAAKAPGADKGTRVLWCRTEMKVSRLEFKLKDGNAMALKATATPHYSPPLVSPDEAIRRYEPDLSTHCLLVDKGYGGCPYCRATSFVYCNNCHSLSCWDHPADGWHVCPHCGNADRVSGSGIKLDIEKAPPPSGLPDKGREQSRQVPALPGKKQKALLEKPTLPGLPHRK